MWRLCVEDLAHAPQARLVEVPLERDQELAAMRHRLRSAAEGGQVRPDERSQEPGPDGPLVVSAVALCGTARVARRVSGFSGRQRAQPVRGEQLLLDGPHDGPSLLGPQQRERKRDGEDLIGPQPWVGPAVPTDHVVEATARRIPENLLEAAFDRLGFVRVGCGRPRFAAPVRP